MDSGLEGLLIIINKTKRGEKFIHWEYHIIVCTTLLLENINVLFPPKMNAFTF
jgi:hypothetical protein